MNSYQWTVLSSFYTVLCIYCIYFRYLYALGMVLYAFSLLIIKLHVYVLCIFYVIGRPGFDPRAGRSTSLFSAASNWSTRQMPERFLVLQAAAATFQLLVPSIHGYIQSRGDLTTPSSPLPTDPSHSLPSANKDPTQGPYLPGKKPLKKRKKKKNM